MQAALDTYQVIRLEPGKDYLRDNPLKQIVIHSGQRIYGLPNKVPDIIIQPGTHDAVVSFTMGNLIFPPSPIVTKGNLFYKVWYSPMTMMGCTLEDNLFLDMNSASIHIDTSVGGYLRNNRFIRVVSHGGSPVVSFQGDSKHQSYGNIFAWMNDLGGPGPQGPGFRFSDLADLTLFDVECEGYSPGRTPAVSTEKIDNLTVFSLSWVLNGGGGRVLDTDATNVWCHSGWMATAVGPSYNFGADSRFAALFSLNDPSGIAGGTNRTSIYDYVDQTITLPSNKYLYENGVVVNPPLDREGTSLFNTVANSRKGVPWDPLSSIHHPTQVVQTGIPIYHRTPPIGK